MTRTIPGLLLAAGWLLLLVFGPFLMFWAVVFLIGIIGSQEFTRMVYGDEIRTVDHNVLAIIITIPILSTLWAINGDFHLLPGLFISFGGMVAFTMYHYRRFENPYVVLTQGVLGIVFVGFLISHLVLVRSLPNGAAWLIILSAITAGSDTGAYWIGCRFGKRKLCAAISPNKTIEGGAGGIFGAVICSMIMYGLVDVQFPLIIVLLLAILLSIAGMVGDLLESIIKRGTGTKDSGTLLGGHGGVLDRVDSLLFAGPVLYYILRYSQI